MNAHTYGFVLTVLVSGALSAGCGAGSDASEMPSAGNSTFGELSQAVTYSPQAVTNNTSKRVFMHVMPWFEAKSTQHGYSRLNKFGQHWTMANCTAETNGLLNRVCADDAPLIGPYSSSDPYVVEYHLLSMKYAGVDGISIDWPGTTALWDFPDNKFNSEAYIQRLSDFGLNFLIVNEDRNYRSGVDNGRYPSVVDGARNDLSCLKAGGTCGNTYFGHLKYERLNGVPVLATFGPITLQSGSQWSSAYAGAGLNESSTYHIALWYENGELGSFNDGSFAWIWQDQNSFLWHQQNYLNNHPYGSIKMASVFPGYNPYYARGGWPTDGLSQSIAANGATTESQLLDVSLSSNANYIQLNTWNDFGEDTEFEPTVGDGTRMLETLQQKLGVPYGKPELDLIKRLFDERVKARKASNTSRQSQLDQASAYLAALNVSGAKSLIDGSSPSPQAQVTRTLKNVGNGQYAYRDGAVVKYTPNPASFGSAAQWTIEDYAGFKRIRNAGNGCLVHIEHLRAYAECDTGTPDGWYSSRWNLAQVGTNYVFSSAWQGTELNCFGNPPAGVQCTERGTATDAQWVYTP